MGEAAVCRRRQNIQACLRALKKINEAHLVCADRGQDAGGSGKSQGRRAAGAAGLKMEESAKLGNTLHLCGMC